MKGETGILKRKKVRRRRRKMEEANFTNQKLKRKKKCNWTKKINILE